MMHSQGEDHFESQRIAQAKSIQRSKGVRTQCHISEETPVRLIDIILQMPIRFVSLTHSDTQEYEYTNELGLEQEPLILSGEKLSLKTLLVCRGW